MKTFLFVTVIFSPSPALRTENPENPAALKTAGRQRGGVGEPFFSLTVQGEILLFFPSSFLVQCQSEDARVSVGRDCHVADKEVFLVSVVSLPEQCWHLVPRFFVHVLAGRPESSSPSHGGHGPEVNADTESIGGRLSSPEVVAEKERSSEIPRFFLPLADSPL